MDDSKQEREEGGGWSLEASVSRRQFLKLAGISAASVAVAGGLAGVLAACGSDQTTTTTPATSASTTGASVTTSASATTTSVSAGGSGVIKIGFLSDYNIPPDVNSRKVLEAWVDGANGRGGWDVGGAKYELQLVNYDNKSDPTTARSAVERLTGEDKVNVVLGDSTAPAWASVTEGAKTVALVNTAVPDIYKPEYKYLFGAGHQPIQTPVLLGYLPGYVGKPISKYAVVYPEDPIGQIMSQDVANGLAALGGQYEMVSFPAATTDFAAVATKIRATGADAVIFNTNNQGLAQLMRALRAGNFAGTPVMLREIPPGEVGAMIPLTELDGLVAGIVTWSTENPFPVAQEAKDDYIAKYGKWDDPGFADLDNYYTYRAAVQAAGTIDADKVADTLATGLTFDGPHGESQMVTRPDQGVMDRTVCLTFPMTMCTMAGGVPTNIQGANLADAQKYCAAVWGAGKK